MNYSLKKEGKTTEVYKAYTAAKLWITTIRHYDEEVAIKIILDEYMDKVAFIKKNDVIIWAAHE